ncbi:LytR/AlgR family response regulator transcription factor [Chitinophagaceae bacterium LWZ2-11]
MKIHCIVVEDDKVSALHLEKLIEQNDSLVLHGSFTNASEAFTFLSQEMIDLIFLDIELPDLTGFELLDQLAYRPQVVLTTSKTEYAFTAFQYNVADYLKKPLSVHRFNEAVEKVKPFVIKQKDKQANDIFIKANGKLIRLHHDDILFVEALGDYVKFVTPQKSYLNLATLKSIEEKLNGDTFIKVHRSYIVNAKKIKDIEDNSILIESHVVPISKAHKKTVMEKLNIL